MRDPEGHARRCRALWIDIYVPDATAGVWISGHQPLLQCRGLSIAPGESHAPTRPHIELPPRCEGLIAPPSPFAPGTVGPSAFGNRIEAAVCQTVVLEFQDAREPLHILWGVDCLPYLVFTLAIVEEITVHQIPMLTTGPAHNLARVDMECMFLWGQVM
jgi:hypothetical protein